MLISVYDPNGKNGDAFSADNHVSGDTNKVFTATEQTKLSGIATGAEVNVQSDWNAASGDAFIANKPTLGTLAAKSAVATADITDAAVTSGKMAAMADGAIKGNFSGSAASPGDYLFTSVLRTGLNSAANATIIADAEFVVLSESPSSYKKITWANVKTALKTALFSTTNGIAKLNGSGVVSAATAGTDYAVPATDYTVTVSATWTGSAAPYTQDVTVTGLSATAKIEVGLASNATSAEYDAAVNAKLHCTAQAAGQITLTAFGEKPTITLPIIVRAI